MNNPKILPAYWSALAFVILIGDYFSGPTIQFPILYFIPVSLSSWYSGYRWGLTYAVIMPLFRLAYHLIFWPVPLTVLDASINTVIRILILGGAAYLVSRTAVQTQALAKKVKVLEGFLPICSVCKKIRDQQGQWHSMEQFITERSEAQFTHGLCIECSERHYGEFMKRPVGPAQIT